MNQSFCVYFSKACTCILQTILSCYCLLTTSQILYIFKYIYITLLVNNLRNFRSSFLLNYNLWNVNWRSRCEALYARELFVRVPMINEYLLIVCPGTRFWNAKNGNVPESRYDAHNPEKKTIRRRSRWLQVHRKRKTNSEMLFLITRQYFSFVSQLLRIWQM